MLFNTATQSYIAMNQYLLLSNKSCKEQFIHMDHRKPLLISALYFNESFTNVEHTIFYDMNSIDFLKTKPLNDSDYDKNLYTRKIISSKTVEYGTVSVKPSRL